jgi:hypothetical protein
LLLTEAWQRLGFARLRDYTTERLGMSARSFYDLAQVARALPALPAIDTAYVRGDITWTKLRLLARVATPDDQPAWLSRARRMTATELAREVRAIDVGSLEVSGALQPGQVPAERDTTPEPRQNFRIRCTGHVQGKWYRTQQFASRVAGHPVRPWQCAEMVAVEVLSAVPLDGPADAIAGSRNAERTATGVAAPSLSQRPPRERSAPTPTKIYPCRVIPTNGGISGVQVSLLASRLQGLVANLDDLDPFVLDARLRHVVRLEQQLDAELGSRLALVAREQFYRVAGFSSFEAYARDRLGISPRKARALLRLERACVRFPAFAVAYQDGALSWVQAHAFIPALLISRGGYVRAWIEWATQISVRRLRDDIDSALLLYETDPERFATTGGLPSETDGGHASKTIDATNERQIGANPRDSLEDTELFVHGPDDVIRLVRAVVCTVRRAIAHRTGRLPTESEAFDVMLEHALGTWGVNTRVRPAHRVFARDGWRCTVPGCSSQQNLHDHHIVFRSAGGSNDLSNRTTLCAWHHLRGVHAGIVRCTGTAPNALRFDLGLRHGQRPLLSFAPGERAMSPADGQPQP